MPVIEPIFNFVIRGIDNGWLLQHGGLASITTYFATTDELLKFIGMQIGGAPHDR